MRYYLLTYESGRVYLVSVHGRNGAEYVFYLVIACPDEDITSDSTWSHEPGWVEEDPGPKGEQKKLAKKVASQIAAVYGLKLPEWKGL